MNQYVEYVVAWMNVKFGLELTASAERQEGQGLVEYALIIVLVSIAAFTAMQLLGTKITDVFTNITGKLNPAS